MLDFLYSFLLFWASTLLMLGYAVAIYTVVAALHYIYEHDKTEATFNDRKNLFILKIAFYVILSCMIDLFGFDFIFYIIDHNFRKGNDLHEAKWINIDLTITSIILVAFIALNVYRIDRKDDYPDFSSYFLNQKFFYGMAAIPVLLFSFYVMEASQWLRKENAHRQAKFYIVAGQNLNYFKWLLTGGIHPEIFFITPITSLQRVIFQRAERLFPDNDAEAAAWENRWFHRHYTRKLRVTLGDSFFAPITEAEHPGSRFLVTRWWHCLEGMGGKSFQDERVKQEIYLLDYARLAYVFHEMMLFYAHNSRTAAREFQERHPGILEDLEYYEEKFKTQLNFWLVDLMNEWKRTPKNRALIDKHPEEEALGQVVLAEVLQQVLRAEIDDGTFRCANESVQRYLTVLSEFHAPKNGEPPAYRRVTKRRFDKTEDIDASDYLQDVAIQATRGWPSYAVERYCGIPVSGRKFLFCSPLDKKQHLTSEQCAERLRHEDEALREKEPQTLKEIFHEQDNRRRAAPPDD